MGAALTYALSFQLEGPETPVVIIMGVDLESPPPSNPPWVLGPERRYRVTP